MFNIPSINWENCVFLYMGSAFCTGVMAYYASINRSIIHISTQQKIQAIGIPLGICALILGICFFIDYVILRRKILI